MAAVQAMARHRLARVPYVGVMRAVVQHAQQARQQQQREQRQRAGFHWSGEAQDVYLALALHQAGRGGWTGMSERRGVWSLVTLATVA